MAWTTRHSLKCSTVPNPTNFCSSTRDLTKSVIHVILIVSIVYPGMSESLCGCLDQLLHMNVALIFTTVKGGYSSNDHKWYFQQKFLHFLLIILKST